MISRNYARPDSTVTKLKQKASCCPQNWVLYELTGSLTTNVHYLWLTDLSFNLFIPPCTLPLPPYLLKTRPRGQTLPVTKELLFLACYCHGESVVGRGVIIHLLRRRCGLICGRWSCKAKYESCPAAVAFRMKRSAVFTADSSFPLLWEDPGEAVVFKFQHYLNSWKSWDVCNQGRWYSHQESWWWSRSRRGRAHRVHQVIRHHYFRDSPSCRDVSPLLHSSSLFQFTIRRMERQWLIRYR